MLKKILEIIPRSFKGKGVLIALSVPLRSALDLVGVAALVPALLMILDDPSAHPFLSSHLPLVIGGMVAVLVVKGLVNLLLVRAQSSYLLTLYKYFSSTLFRRLFSKGLLSVKDTSSSSLAFNINGACYNLSTAYLTAVFTMAGEVIFSVMLLAAIAMYSPLSMVLIIVSLTPVVLLYFLLVKNTISKLGKQEFEVRKGQQKRVQNAFKGYSEVVISNSYPQIESKFIESLDQILDFRRKSITIGAVPSLLLEIAVMLIITVFVVMEFSFSDSGMKVFLGVFAVALLRMIPSVKSIISAWSTMRSSKYSIDMVYDYFKETEPEAEPTARVSFEKSIVLDNVSFAYPGQEKPVLENVSFEIAKGEIIGIQGKSGSGKTTLFTMLLGLVKPDSGSIKVDGKVLGKDFSTSSWHRIIGYVPQEVFINDELTLEENIALGYQDIYRTLLEDAISKAELMEFADSLPEGTKTLLGEAGSKISGGQKQRIGIARALYKRASVLFFDEATSNLDNATESEIDRAILDLKKRNPDLTILIISHRDSSLKICDRILSI